jgi:perosamine synthetase
MFPALDGKFSYAPGDFPQAEAFHAATIKLPVWHKACDLALAMQYAAAIRKVSAHHADLLQ